MVLIPSKVGEISGLAGSRQGAICMFGSQLLRHALAMLAAARSLQLLPHLQACCTSALKVCFILRRHNVPERVRLPQDLQCNNPGIMVLNHKHQWRILRPDREAEVEPALNKGPRHWPGPPRTSGLGLMRRRCKSLVREVMDMCVAAAPGCWSGAHSHLACGLLVQVDAPLLSGRRGWVTCLAQVLIVLPLSHGHACRLQAAQYAC